LVNIKVLDRGSVELISSTCKGDLLVVNAARCSFDKAHEIFENDKDAKLINYLAKHKHLLPFRHPSATIRIVAPLFVLRQIGKHQVGFSWSEVSRRYIKSEPEFYIPWKFRARPNNVKQGSINEEPKGGNTNARVRVGIANKYALQEYSNLLEMGVCPEQARMVLPQSMYTTTVTTGTLLGWHHMFTQRTDPHTQLETQEYAKAIGKIMEELFPVSWKALCQHS
jgi:thymidylate synthase (FAD)